MSNIAPVRPRVPKAQTQREGIALLLGIVALMWFVEVINAADGYHLDSDGIYSRDFGRLWGIFTAPFIHANFAPHLLDNTIPLVFMGLIIALAGAARLAAVTLIVIVIGGLGTWLIGPAGISTIGASGLVFGYATYLFARGFFNRNALELVVGLVVGVIWGGALVASLVPHTGVSWQGHVCGAIAGVIAALLLRRERRPSRQAKPGVRSAAQALAK
ncbi:MAG TPA: rhomboid family intramembrane serine protease [Solirubrobacteraceae bacterium]|nr:rhomboid family intramembrane serine protease [Solirubrobacteraceae bacterium]